MNKRRFASDFKFKVVLEALSERYSIQELGRKYQIHPNQISTWKTHFLKQGSAVFERGQKAEKSPAQEKEDQLLKTIGQLKVENDFLKNALS